MKPFSNDQIDVEVLPRVNQLILIPLEPKYRTVMLIMKTLFLAVLVGLACLVFFGALFGLPVAAIMVGGIVKIAALLFFIVFICLSYLSTFKSFSNKHYALRQKDIVFKSGWIWKQTTTVPFNRIQHVSIDQGPLERNFDLAKLRVFTAGGSGSDLTIPGLTMDTATELKEFIVKKTEMDEEE